MNKKIFRSGFVTALLVLASSLLMIVGILFDFFERQIEEELGSEAAYISHAIEIAGSAYIHYFDNSEKRITWINADGEVLADTSMDTGGLDNHANRQEVREALEKGVGTSVRYSDTLMEKNIYYAVKLRDGSVLRVSTTQYSVIAVLLKMLRPLLAVLAAALIMSYLLSRRISEGIIRPINELDLNDPLQNETYEELAPLLAKLSVQKDTIAAQLREAKQKQEEFRLITENMSEGFLIIDRQTNPLTYNQAAAELLQIGRGDNGPAFGSFPNFRETMEKALSGERTESQMTLERRHYNLIASPVFEEEEVIGAVMLILDVTEEVEREQMRREFTSNVSHELKTPLTSISGFAEIMKAGGNAEETVIDFSTSIYEEAQRLISLVGDIIKISRLDEGAAQYEREEIDLYELTGDILERLSFCAKRRNISLRRTGESVKVNGIRKILEDMIYNLCDNAIKYNKDNGVVDVIFESSDGGVKLSVRDCGLGIPSEDMPRVFERFYRVDKSHSKTVGGTGLGLSIVKHGAICHNAEVDIESVEGEGTCVSILFRT